MRKQRAASKRPAQRRILVVDEYDLARRGLRALIESEPDLTVCAEAVTQTEALAAVARFHPDLVIADLLRSVGDEMVLVQEIRRRHPQQLMLVFSMLNGPLQVAGASQAGAQGFVSKLELGENVLAAIRCVLGGGKYGSPKSGGGLSGN